MGGNHCFSMTRLLFTAVPSFITTQLLCMYPLDLKGSMKVSLMSSPTKQYTLKESWGECDVLDTVCVSPAPSFFCCGRILERFSLTQDATFYSSMEICNSPALASVLVCRHFRPLHSSVETVASLLSVTVSEVRHKGQFLDTIDAYLPHPNRKWAWF